MGYDVFISHSKDNEIADAIYDYLLKSGIQCFLDIRSLKPGELFPSRINEARESCSVVVLLLSSESDNSIAVNSELNDLYKKKKIIPLRIQDFEPKNLMIFIGAIQWLDAYTSPFDQHLPALLEAVGHYLDVKPHTEQKLIAPEDIVSYLKKYVKELTLNYPSFIPQEERLTIGEHALRTLRLFEKYRSYNKFTFPDNLISRDKFTIVLALHDVGMAIVSSRSEIHLKYDETQKKIKWLISQTNFKNEYYFNAQEERISLALVSNEPIWRYLNNRFDEITCAEQILNMALRAGIEPDSESLSYFYRLVMIYYMCDAGSYSKTVGGDRDYDFIKFDTNNKEIKFAGTAIKKVIDLESVVEKIVKGSIPFTKAYWKPIKQQYLSSWVNQNIDKLKMGKVLEGKYYKYRLNSELKRYEVQPLSGTKLPALKDPN